MLPCQPSAAVTGENVDGGAVAWLPVPATGKVPYGAAVKVVAEGAFAGYLPQDAFEHLRQITAEDAADWVRGRLAPERFALSIIYPREV